MMFAGNPGVMAAGAGGKTYDEFVAHIVSLAGGQTAPWRSEYAWPSGGAVTTLVGSVLDRSMIGSSWTTHFRGDAGSSYVSRVVQHGMPDQDSFNEQLASGLQIFLRFTTPAAVTEFFSLNRNGYLSSASTTGLSFRRHLVELIYWDGLRAQRMQPSLGLGPEPYDW